ncbi:chalcone isomerase family protein [Thalassolituus sp. LLYu03]|uniref:chalcone isomerase family protein n=1 Tax=Thalassolituus sp. LLYu03 TaxID=3421656 RepID=UPI003D28ECD9
MIRSFALALMLTCVAQVQALTLKDIEIPAIIPATKDSPEMVMRGASIRKVYGFVESYVGVLYVANNTLADDDIVIADEARRMTFYVTSSRVSARRFTNAIHEGLSINVTKAEMDAMSDRLAQLVALFDHKFVEGTIGFIEWVPDLQTTRVTIDGKVRGTVDGKDLNDALLKIWIGDHPVSERFKEEVLGHRED